MIQSILSNYWHHINIDVTVDRTLDIVRAATANRRELGLDMIMDETADVDSLVVKTKEATVSVEEGVVEVEGMDVEIGKKIEGM